jgi:Tol biopolymer transport system component
MATIIRVSTAADGTQANGFSIFPVFSPNGSKVAFTSNAPNLVAGDTNGLEDVFVKDLASGAITRVSTAADGTQANGFSNSPVFPSNGSKIAFESSASNLVAGDTNGLEDIFVKDLASGAITRVSTAADGTQGVFSSIFPAFSPDGSKIAFESNAYNLVAGDTNGTPDIFVKDLASGAITRVSTAADGTQANGPSVSDTHPVFSPDGSKIAFISDASNLVAGDTNGQRDIFVKELASGAITRVNTAADGTQANGFTNSLVFSPDGTKIAFMSLASSLVAGDTNVSDDIFVKDLASGAITRVSAAADGTQGNNNSVEPVFSPDGSKIAFESFASNLVPGDTNGLEDIFVKDLASGVITLVSTAADSSLVNDFPMAFSPDGSKIAFTSDGSNLVAGDTNNASDVFIATLTVPPSLAITTQQASLPEGDKGTTLFGFTVTRSGDTSGSTSVNWGVSAASGSPTLDAADFVGNVLPSGTLSFASHEMSKTILVPVAGDRNPEPNESFVVTLANASGVAAITTPAATAIIVNDDFPKRNSLINSLSDASLTSSDPNSISTAEVVNIARASVGQFWTENGCTDFVWAVTNLAGAPFFDLRKNLLVNNNPLEPKDINYVVPHRNNPDEQKDDWQLLQIPQSFGATLTHQELQQILQPGDVVRAYKFDPAHPSSEADGHSFVVSSRAMLANGDVAISIIDNTDGIVGNPDNAINEHPLYAFPFIESYLSHADHVYISRLNTPFLSNSQTSAVPIIAGAT